MMIFHLPPIAARPAVRGHPLTGLIRRAWIIARSVPAGRAASLACALLLLAAAPDQQHAFDFEFGTWKIQWERLERPLSGSHTWVSVAGRLHVVQRVWNGQASLAQLEVDGARPRFLGLMLRTYDPATQEWRIYWASSDDGTIDPPLTGRFNDGRGVFLGRTAYEGRTVLVRVVYSDISATSFRTEESFSRDGSTWEPVLEQRFTRLTRG
jgi:hypothetical protein